MGALRSATLPPTTDSRFSMRTFNFSAGPATLPLSVLEDVRAEMLDYRGTGMSIIEMSHRSAPYEAVHRGAIGLVRELAAVPDEFEILLLQGGATLQFSMVPMNLLASGGRAAYVDTGAWASKAIADAAIHGDVYVPWTGRDGGYRRAPEPDAIAVAEGTRYLHITSNETIGGVQYRSWPKVDAPLVADMSSDFLSRPVPWERFDLAYAGVQKNLGPAGLAVVVVRGSLLGEARPAVGAYLRYEAHGEKASLYNTPPVFSIYVMEKVLRWMADEGGVPAMESAAIRRSQMVYDEIDASDGFYRSPVDAESRSRTNVVFRIADPGREPGFIVRAAERGLVGLGGHRSVGGIRASLYNAMPVEGVEALVAFMNDFRARRS